MQETAFTARQLLESCREEFRPERMRRIGDFRFVRSAPSVVAITQSEPRLQIEVLHLIMEILSSRNHRSDIHWWLFSRLAEVLLVSRLPLSAADLVKILRVLAPYAGTMGAWNCALSATKRYIDEFGCPFEIARVIVPQWDELRRKTRNYYAPLFDQIADATDTIPDGALVPGERWVDVVDNDLAAMPDEIRQCWDNLFALGVGNRSTTPSQRWQRDAARHIALIGAETFQRQVVNWFQLLNITVSVSLPDRNARALRGLAWACGSYDDVILARALGNLAESLLRKIPDIGPRSRLAGNGCLYALSIMPGVEPVAQLNRLSTRLKGDLTQAAVAKALNVAARRAGISRETLEELSVPTFGLDASRRFRQTLGAHTTEIAITEASDVVWRWFTEDGKPRKSVPAVIRAEHASELKSLKETYTTICKFLPAQRDRLERLLVEDRIWSLADWRARYIDHPLLASMTRRLIWHIHMPESAGTLATFLDGQLMDVQGQRLGPLPETAQVRLWHPITSDAQTVLAWRIWFEDHHMVQPFKQAHRELYLLTDAEMNTATYSNRFAAHILQQHQFYALCQQRSWTYHRQGGFQSWYDSTASRALPRWGLTAQLWVTPIDDAPGMASGLFTYITTDQVRFVNTDGMPRPLVDVPARLFTEVIRDVDLFVGVTSIGNDPTWQDGGNQRFNRPFVDYWQQYALGELAASGESRRDVLARLLPKLKIAARCTLTERFLVVHGSLRTYKIHLGSGNILMAPNDQYLCIVPARGTAENADGTRFLPFEGDTMLSLILSKAFLLAADTAITDPTIMRQIVPQ